VTVFPERGVTGLEIAMRCTFSSAGSIRRWSNRSLPIRAAVSSANMAKFKHYQFVSYRSLGAAANAPGARQRARQLIPTATGFEEQVVDGFHEDYGLDVNQYMEAVEIVEEVFGRVHPERLWFWQEHHRNVVKLFRKRGPQIAMRYDVRTRLAAANDPSHDVAKCNQKFLDEIIDDLRVQQLSVTAATAATAGPRPAPATSRPAKRARADQPKAPGYTLPPGAHCFRCGQIDGHAPCRCRATQTITKRLCAELDPASDNGLLTKSGKQYCFDFALKSSCKGGSGCPRYHGCSICGDKKHGARSCPRVAGPAKADADSD
jgi:hypothetical protein